MKNQEIFRKRLGEHLVETRKRANKTQVFIATSIGITPNGVLLYEKGINSIPFENLLLYLKYCNKDYIEFMNEIKSIMERNV